MTHPESIQWHDMAVIGDIPVDQIAAADLRRWIAELRTRGRRWLEHPHRPPIEGGLSQASVAGYVRAAKRLFNFLQELLFARKHPRSYHTLASTRVKSS